MSNITNWPPLLPVWIHIYIKINACIYINATTHLHFKLNFCFYCSTPAVLSRPTRGPTPTLWEPLRVRTSVDTFTKPRNKNEAASVSHLHWKWFLASVSWRSWFITICLTERLWRLIRRYLCNMLQFFVSFFFQPWLLFSPAFCWLLSCATHLWTLKNPQCSYSVDF